MRLFAETHGPIPLAVDSMRPTEFALSLFKEAGLSDRDTVRRSTASADTSRDS